MINRGGEKLFPSLIEPVFLQYPGVEYASVFPVSDEILGEIPAAILVEKENEKINLEEIKKDLPGKIHSCNRKRKGQKKSVKTDF